MGKAEIVKKYKKKLDEQKDIEYGKENEDAGIKTKY
jgi:hypothetical protein